MSKKEEIEQETEAQVDRYVRGQMSEAEAFDFEVSYIGNPDLLARVELATKLQAGLSGLTETKKLPVRPDIGESVVAWVQDLIVPQTAWGAIAASVLLVPLLLLENSSIPMAPAAAPSSVYLLGGAGVRGSEDSTFTINLNEDMPALVLGFQTPAIFGPPVNYDLSINGQGDLGQVAFEFNDLAPDFQRVIYISIDSRAFLPGDYEYVLRDPSGAEISSGVLLLESDGS